jgi:hypothetical protein
MLNSLRLRMEVDNASVMRGMSQVDQKIIQTGANISEHLTDKLKGAFAVGAIEEMVRRTGEWNLELDRSADKLQVTREHLQALRILSEKAGVSVEKIQTYYNKMEVASLNALKGNHKLSESFKALKTNATEVNRAFTSGDKEAQGNLLAKMVGARGNPGGQEAVMNIFGAKAVTDVNSLGRQLGGGTIDDYAKSHAAQIIPEQRVQETAKAWEDLLETAKSLGIKFSALATIVIKIVDGLLNMVNGTLATLGAYTKIGTKEGRDKLVIRSASIARNLGNILPQLASGVVNKFGGHKDWHWFDTPQKAYGNALTDQEYKDSEGGADAALTLGTFGYGPVARIAGVGVKGAGAAATFARAGKVGEALGGAGAAIGSTSGGGLVNKIIEGVFKNPSKGMINKLAKDLGVNAAELTGADEAAFKELLAPRLANRTALIGKWADTLGYSMAGYSAGNRTVHNAITQEAAQKALEGKAGAGTNPVLLHGMSGLNFAGGSGNSAVGGVFGTNIQAKLVSLNQRMVSLLERLVSNTNPLRDTANSLVGGQNEDWVGN